MGASASARVSTDDSYTAADEDTDDLEIRGSLTRENVPLSGTPKRKHSLRATIMGSVRLARASHTTGNSVKPANYGRMHEEPALRNDFMASFRGMQDFEARAKALGDMLAFNAKVGAVLSVCAGMQQAADGRAALAQLCDTARELLPIDLAVAYEVAGDVAVVVAASSYSDDADALEGATVPLNGSFVGEAVLVGDKLLQSHASAGDPRLLGRDGALADAYRIVLGDLEGSALACTLRVRNSGGGGGRASHVLECHCNAAERLSGGDLYLLNCLRRCALPMLAQAERRPQLRARQRLPNLLAVSHSLHGFVETMRTEIIELLEVEDAEVYLLDDVEEDGTSRGSLETGRGTSFLEDDEKPPPDLWRYKFRARAGNARTIGEAPPAGADASRREFLREYISLGAASITTALARSALEGAAARGADGGGRAPIEFTSHVPANASMDERFSAKIDGGDDGDGSAAAASASSVVDSLLAVALWSAKDATRLLGVALLRNKVRRKKEAVVASSDGFRVGEVAAACEYLRELGGALQSALAKERERLWALEAREKQRQAEGVLELVKCMTREVDVTELFGIAVAHIVTVLRCDRATLFLKDPTTDPPTIWSMVPGPEAGKLLEIRVPLDGNSISGAVVSTLKLLRLADAYDDARFNQAFDRKTGYRTRSLLCVPVVDESGDERTVLGCIQCLNKETLEGRVVSFSDADAAAAVSFAAVTAAAIQHARMSDTADEVVDAFIKSELAGK